VEAVGFELRPEVLEVLGHWTESGGSLVIAKDHFESGPFDLDRLVELELEAEMMDL
jgi:hypothetical protein